GYFSVLGVRPAAGRLFTEDEERIHGAEPLVVLSYTLWQRMFGGSRAAINGKLLLNAHPVRIVGVAPEHFHGMTVGLEPDVWVPAILADQIYPANRWLENRNARTFFVIGRLAAGATIARARAVLDVLARQL